MSTKITVMMNDEPVENATVLIGGVVGEAMTTNVRGNVTFELGVGWQGFVDVMVDTGSFVATSTVHIVEGETHTVDLGNIEI